MSLEIQTNVIKPKRFAYKNVSDRIGDGKTASRYEEATLDMQPTEHFHYRPTYDPAFELYDQAKTAIKMKDWYTFRDPRQLYYGTYTIARNKLREVNDASFSFVEKHKLLADLSSQILGLVKNVLLPFRHYEWGSNMNNFEICRFGYGTPVTQAASFCAMDRLGMAQILSRIGISIDPSGELLESSREIWLQNAEWQGLRHVVEDSFVIKDWFELYSLQNFLMDAYIFPLVYSHMDKAWRAEGGAALTMLTEFMRDWVKDHTRWVDATMKTAIGESTENKAVIEGYISKWQSRVKAAIAPLAEAGLGAEADEAMALIETDLDKRLKRMGLSAGAGL